MTCTTGGCLCGAVTYRLTKEPASYGACHCGMCRRWSGGVHFGLQVGQQDGVVFDKDDTLQRYQSSDWAERAFCSTCGTHLYWRMTAQGPMPGMTVMAAGTLDDMTGLALDSEIYIDHKPAGYAFAGNTQKITESELMAMMATSGQGDQS